MQLMLYDISTSIVRYMLDNSNNSIFNQCNYSCYSELEIKQTIQASNEWKIEAIN